MITIMLSKQDGKQTGGLRFQNAYIIHLDERGLKRVPYDVDIYDVKHVYCNIDLFLSNQLQ